MSKFDMAVINQQAIIQSLASSKEYSTAKEAEEAMKRVIKGLKSVGVNTKKMKHIEIKDADESVQVASVFDFNGALALVRMMKLPPVAKFYVPEVVWCAHEVEFEGEIVDDIIAPIVSTRPSLTRSEKAICEAQDLKLRKPKKVKI